MVLVNTPESPLDSKEFTHKEFSLLREINPEHLLEGLMLKLKVHNIGHVI